MDVEICHPEEARFHRTMIFEMTNNLAGKDPAGGVVKTLDLDIQTGWKDHSKKNDQGKPVGLFRELISFLNLYTI